MILETWGIGQIIETVNEVCNQHLKLWNYNNDLRKYLLNLDHKGQNKFLCGLVYTHTDTHVHSFPSNVLSSLHIQYVKNGLRFLSESAVPHDLIVFVHDSGMCDLRGVVYSKSF